MAIQHRAGAAAAHLMPDPVDLEPLLCGFFAATDPVTHTGVKNFRAAAGDRAKPMLAQQFERLPDRQLKNSIGKMSDLDGGESFDVQLRAERAEIVEEAEIPLLLQTRMQTTDHVHIGDAQGKGFADGLNDFTGRVFEGMSVAFLGCESAELTR